jgi:four helix bundle protein
MGDFDLKMRTKRFALAILAMAKHMPRSSTGQIVGRQLIRSATSVGANYRAACRARSQAEFFSKIGIVIEEADEAAYWLELLIEIRSVPEEIIQPRLNEADELIAIMTQSRKTAQSRS